MCVGIQMSTHDVCSSLPILEQTDIRILKKMMTAMKVKNNMVN